MIVALHLEIEDLAFSRGRCWDEMVVQQCQNAAADVAELLLDLSGSAKANQLLGPKESGGSSNHASGFSTSTNA